MKKRKFQRHVAPSPLEESHVNNIIIDLESLSSKTISSHESLTSLAIQPIVNELDNVNIINNEITNLDNDVEDNKLNKAYDSEEEPLIPPPPVYFQSKSDFGIISQDSNDSNNDIDNNNNNNKNNNINYKDKPAKKVYVSKSRSRNKSKSIALLPLIHDRFKTLVKLLSEHGTNVFVDLCLIIVTKHIEFKYISPIFRHMSQYYNLTIIQDIEAELRKLINYQPRSSNDSDNTGCVDYSVYEKNSNDPLDKPIVRSPVKYNSNKRKLLYNTGVNHPESSNKVKKRLILNENQSISTVVQLNDENETAKNLGSQLDPRFKTRSKSSNISRNSIITVDTHRKSPRLASKFKSRTIASNLSSLNTSQETELSSDDDPEYIPKSTILNDDL